MTHIQEVFIKNLRYLRKKRGISQLRFSEILNISPNYLNAVENGKNFPSPEVIQNISDALKVFPFQLFYEHQPDHLKSRINSAIPELMSLKQKLNKEIDELIKKLEN